MLLLLAGCESGVVNVRALQHLSRSKHQPNLPVQLHQRNWQVRWAGQLCSCLAGEPSALAQQVRTRRTLASNLCRWRVDSRLRDRLDAAGVDYSYTLNGRSSLPGLGQRNEARSDPLVEAGALLHVRRLDRTRWKAICCDPRQQLPGTLRAYASRTVHSLMGGLWRLRPNRSQRPSSSLPYQSYEVL